MKHAPIVALALMAALVAGCGGGSSTRITDLEKELAAAQAAQEAAQEEARKAEEAAKAARLARLEAERQADAAQEEARKAEEATEAARLEAKQQADAALAAEQQRQQEQEARQEADSKAADLEEEAGHTADQLVQANARQVLAGLEDYIDDEVTAGTRAGTADPTVTPRYRESALVTTAPAVTFSSITTGTSGNWFRTSFSNRAFDLTDRLDVYSDADSPDQVPFKDSIYNDGDGDETVVPRYNPGGSGTSMVIDGEGDVVGSVRIVNDLLNAAASPFPRSGDPAKSFTLTDRGKYTTEERRRSRLDPTDGDHLDITFVNDDDDATPYTGTYRNAERYPLRYTYEAGGSLSGASGTYTCASAMSDASCRVTNQNNHFRFVGPWVFTPGASSRVRVDDAEIMYFGWWAQQTNADGSWEYRTFHGPTETGADGNRSTAGEISQLSGTATYQGPAVGQYSFYQPLTSHSEYGEFSARATLTADFGDIANTGGTVRGTIDQFADHPDWTLTLKQRTISGGVIPTTGTDATNAVSWQIEDEAVAAPDSGTWEAAFYSDLSADLRTSDGPDEDAVPTGMAGTFEAEYHHVGRIIGAFGAHKQP